MRMHPIHLPPCIYPMQLLAHCSLSSSCPSSLPSPYQVVARRKDGAQPLGWCVLDTRKAKLNAQYTDPEGVLMVLMLGSPSVYIVIQPAVYLQYGGTTV